MLLPITFGFEPVTALIMLAGIYYGAQYGGSTTAILINLPGESSAAVTAIDGHEMAAPGPGRPGARHGRHRLVHRGHGRHVVLVLFAPPLAGVALTFGSAEFFALVVLGLIASIALARGSTVKALAMIVLGLLFGTVGQDIFTGTPRFTFGMRELYGGINFVSVAVGMFGVAEILRNLEDEATRTASITQRRQPLADPGGPPAHRPTDPARHGARIGARESCPAPATCWPRSRRTPSRSGSRGTHGVRPRRDRGRRRARSRRTTPPPRRRSSRC